MGEVFKPASGLPGSAPPYRPFNPVFFFLFLLLLLLSPIPSSSSLFPRKVPLVLNKLDQIVYSYPNKDEGKGVCKNDCACGLVHQQLWFLPRVDVYCSCPTEGGPPIPCFTPDQPTYRLNDRASLKLCKESSELARDCSENEGGLWEENDGNKVTVRVACSCPRFSFWRLSHHTHNSTHTINGYQCSKMTFCGFEDFCGHLRADTFSLYQECACPKETLCISRDTTLYQASEPLYSGPVLKAYCRKVKSLY